MSDKKKERSWRNNHWEISVIFNKQQQDFTMLRFNCFRKIFEKWDYGHEAETLNFLTHVMARSNYYFSPVSSLIFATSGKNNVSHQNLPSFMLQMQRKIFFQISFISFNSMLAEMLSYSKCSNFALLSKYYLLKSAHQILLQKHDSKKL